MWNTTVWKRVKFENVVPKSAKYKYITREASRLDMHAIPGDLETACLHYARTLGEQGGPYFRVHLKNRLKEYVNKLSRNREYVEVLPHEVPEIEDLPALVQHEDLTPVEVGFNRQKEVCKIAYTTKLITTGRTLFICIGLDGGLKTFYVTPEFKHRASYQCSDTTVVEKLKNK